MAGLKNDFTSGDRANRLDQVGFGGVLQQVAFCPGLQRAQDVGFVRVHAEHHHRNARVGGDNLARCLDAV